MTASVIIPKPEAKDIVSGLETLYNAYLQHPSLEFRETRAQHVDWLCRQFDSLSDQGVVNYTMDDYLWAEVINALYALEKVFETHGYPEGVSRALALRNRIYETTRPY
jgi:5'(3')-deoxyribonucleotidase